MAHNMAQTFTGRKRIRKFFGHIREVAEMPNLIEVQKASYDQFLLVNEPEGGRPDEGLHRFLSRFSRFPIFRTRLCSNLLNMNSSRRNMMSTNAVNAA